MKLVRASDEYGPQIMDYRRAFLESGDSMDGTGDLRRFEDPHRWIEYLNASEDLQFLFVREEDSKVVGMLQIRPVMNDYLNTYGGHIGYSIAPDERRKGYAALMLKTALPICAGLGIRDVLVTCLKDNEASRKTILKNGGVYESTVIEPDEGPVERYRIRTEAEKNG